MRVTAAVCASILLTATPALTQPKPPTPQQKEQAGDLVKRAIAKSQAGDHQGAIELYLQAYAIVPLPLLLSNLGSEYKALQKPVESLRYFCKYLEADPTGTNVTYAKAEAKLAQHELTPAATDDEVCAAPRAVTPPPPPPPPKPDPSLELRHEVGGTTSTEDAGHGLKLGGSLVAGAGVIGLGVGIYFGTRAHAISKEISDHDPSQPWPNDINDREKAGQAAENKQILFLVTGGVAIGVGVVLYVMGRSKNEHANEPSVAVRPVATLDSVGFALDGRF